MHHKAWKISPCFLITLTIFNFQFFFIRMFILPVRTNKSKNKKKYLCSLIQKHNVQMALQTFLHEEINVSLQCCIRICSY